MKLLSFTLILSILIGTLAVRANSYTALADVCFNDMSYKNDPIIGRVTIHQNYVTVGYYSFKGEGLGSDRGLHITPLITKTSIKLVNVTLHDGRDGWLDNMNIEVTKTTVSVTQKGDKKVLRAIVTCPKTQFRK